MVLLIPMLSWAFPIGSDGGFGKTLFSTLPEAIFLHGTPTAAGAIEIHLLILQEMVMTDEGGPKEGWYSRRYVGAFRIHECLEDGEGKSYPGECRGEGRFLDLRTRENPARGIIRFDGEIVIDQGVPPFDASGYRSSIHGQSMSHDPEGPPWNRLNCSAQFLGDLVGNETVTWGGVKRRFR